MKKYFSLLFLLCVASILPATEPFDQSNFFRATIALQGEDPTPAQFLRELIFIGRARAWFARVGFRETYFDDLFETQKKEFCRALLDRFPDQCPRIEVREGSDPEARGLARTLNTLLVFSRFQEGSGGGPVVKVWLDWPDEAEFPASLEREMRASGAFYQRKYEDALGLYREILRVNPAFGSRSSWLYPSRLLENSGLLPDRALGDILVQVYQVAGKQVVRQGPFRGTVQINSDWDNKDCELAWIQAGNDEYPIEIGQGMGNYKNLRYFEVNNDQQYILTVPARSAALHLGQKTAFLVLTVLYQARDPRFSISRADEVFIQRI